MRYHSAENQFERFRGVLELMSRFEFEFRRRENISFERFEFLVCSKVNHTQCCRTCGCAVACLRPRNSISNVVVSLTIHDKTKIFFGDACKKKNCGRSCKSFVIFGFWWRKTNRTIRQLSPSAVSLSRAGVDILCQVKRMIGGIGDMLFSTFSQT